MKLQMMMKLVGREWASRSMCMGYRVRMLMEFIACSRLGLGGVKSMMVVGGCTYFV
jgi:hypothetical protein